MDSLNVQWVEFAGFGPELSAAIISGSVFGTCFLCIALSQFGRWLKYRHDNALDTTGRANRVNVTYESTYWPPEAAAVLSGRGKLRPPNTNEKVEPVDDVEEVKVAATEPDDNHPLLPVGDDDEDRDADVLYSCTCEMIAEAAVCSGMLR